jgi:hypothetical protein
MAKRRMTGYGSAPMPKSPRGGFPLPPPPDGKPPVRLALGQGGAPPQAQAPPEENMTAQSDDEMLQILRMLGARPDQQ